jgi:predicted permease
MDLIRTLLSRCAAPFRRQKLDADLDEELRIHIDLATEENRKRGMSREQARRAALRHFGGVTQVRETYRTQRGLPFLEVLAHDLRFAVRQFRKSPGFALTAALTLALGIGANTAIFSVVKAVLLVPLPYNDPSRIVAVWTTNPAKGGEPLPSTPADFAVWKQRSNSFEDLAPSYDDEKTLTGQEAPQFLIGYGVSASYLNILGVQPQIGRLYSAQEDKPGGPSVALLSDHLWRTTFHHPDTDSGNRAVLVPLRQQLDGDIRKPLLILMGAAVLVLLIACANTAGLAVARDAERQKEIAVRLALGATRVRLLQQFVTESLLMAAIGGAAGILLAFAGTHFLVTLFPNDVANLSIPSVTKIPIDRGVFLFALLTTLLTAFLSGIAPVLKAAKTEAGGAMHGTTRAGTPSRQSNRARSAVVATEIALSLMLLTGAGLVVASFQKVVNADLGFQPDHVLSLQLFLPPDRYPRADQHKISVFVDEVVNRLAALPGVKSAAATNFLPLTGFWGTTNFLLRGQAQPKEGDAPEADNRVITPEYLRTMGVPLLRGRAFTNEDRAGGLPVTMINQTFARQYFKDADPVGRELNLGTAEKPEWWRIVGVTGDVKSFGQDQPTHADIYRTFDQDPFPIIAFTLRTESDPAAIVKTAEQTLWSVDPDLPVFKAIPMDVLANQTLAVRRASSVLISGFAVLALMLACIGIYAAMAYAVTQRTPEIGVRMALGARRADVLRMVLGFGFRITLIGVAIGLAGALALSRLLSSLLFETSAISPLIFSLATGALVGIALLASLVPARRAASIDPMRALRAE